MNSGAITWPIFDALSAFWPGLQVLAGDVANAGHTLTAFMQVLALLYFVVLIEHRYGLALVLLQKCFTL